MLMSQATSVIAGLVFLLRLIISDRGTRSLFLKSKGSECEFKKRCFKDQNQACDSNMWVHELGRAVSNLL